MIWTYARKSKAINFIRKAIKLIETRYSGKIVFIRSDGERTLGYEFKELMAELEII